MKSVKFKIRLIIVVQTIIVLFLLSLMIWNIVLFATAGKIASISDLLRITIEKSRYITLLLAVSGIIGIFCKKKISWNISAMIFYTMTLMLLSTLYRFHYNMFEIITYIPVIFIFLFIDYTLNSESILKYYNIDLTKTNRLKINIAPILISIGVALFLFFSNY